MTVCIAALSDNGKKAVLVADKMLSTPGLFPYQSEGTGEKILKINDDVHVMWAGGLNDASNIITKAKGRIKSPSKLTTHEIAEQVREAYSEYLFRDVFEREVLQGRGIPNLEAFYGDATINLTDKTRQEIEALIPVYTLNSNTTILVCGKSGGLYTIYAVGPNPRFNPALATEGWTTTGSGAFHAQFSIIHSSYSLKLPQNEVKNIVLEAKKKAEKTPDVGKSEDIVLLE